MNNRNKKLAEIEQLRVKGDSEASDELVNFLSDKDNAVRLTALEALTGIDLSARAIKELVNLTEDPDYEIRMCAVEALNCIQGETVLLALAKRLKDKDELDRIAAAETLGDYGGEAVPYLGEAILDKSALVRSYAAHSLGYVGGKEVIPILREGLKREKSNRARLGFYVGLCMLGEQHYFYSILHMLKAKSYKIRCAAANSLPELANDDTVCRIKRELEKALSREKTIAARSSIEESLMELSLRRSTILLTPDP